MIKTTESEDFLKALQFNGIIMKKSPNKTFIAAPGVDGTCNCANCPFMALNDLEKLYLAMQNEAPRIEMPEKLRLSALIPLQKMLSLSTSLDAKKTVAV